MMNSSRHRVLSQTDVLVSSAPVRVGDDRLAGVVAACGSADQPQVSIQRDSRGDVTEIHVRCGCGEMTVIQCRYDG